MRSTTALKFIVGAGIGVGFGRPVQSARRLHPLRDPEGHDNKKTGEDDKDKKDPPKPRILSDEEAALEAANQAAADAKAQADWLIAEANWKLTQEQEKGKTEEQRQFDARVATAVAEQLPAKITEATVPLHDRIADLQDKLITKTFDAELAEKGIKRDQVKGVLGTLDMTKFLNEDGSVNEEVVKSCVAGLSASSETRPPRGNRAANVLNDDRGFGRYLNKNNQ